MAANEASSDDDEPNKTHNERMNEWTKQDSLQTNDRMNEWTNEWTSSDRFIFPVHSSYSTIRQKKERKKAEGKMNVHH